MLPHCLNMVRCHSNRRIDNIILVVNNIEFETLSSDSIVSNLRVAPYFCSRSDPQYDKRKSRSWHSDMKLVTKTLLVCKIITLKNLLLQIGFSLSYICFCKINSHLSQLFVEGIQIVQDYL